MATARKLPSGSWRCQVYDYTDENGKRHYVSFTSADPSPKGKRKAEMMAAEFALKKEQRDSIRMSSTLGQAMKDYCDLKDNVLSPTTIREYRRMVKLNYDDLKSIPLKNLENDIIQRWVNAFSAGRRPKTVRNAYGLLSAVLDTYAPDIRLNITLPQKITSELYVPSDADIKAVCAFFSQNDTDMELAVYLAAFGTLRRSEICGLHAEDIKGNTIHIHRAMVDKGNSNWVLKTTKTASSTRYVDMPEFVIKKFPKTGPVVKITPDQITHRFAKALKQLEIKNFRFHDLRHYAASIMHAIGIPDQYIMQRGGWSSDRTLKSIYRGTIEDYTKKYTDIALNHFDSMQHEMQHEIEKAQ